MDLAWKVVLEFLLLGRSTKIRAAIDTTNLGELRLMLQDDEAAVDSKRLRSWYKVSQNTCLTPYVKQATELALLHRDAVALRRLVRTLLHLVCVRIRVVCQEADAPRSVHVVWYSRAHNQINIPVCTHGPKAPYRQGMTMLVTINSQYELWIDHIFLYYCHIKKDDTLWENEGKLVQTVVHGLMTPLKRVDERVSANESPALPQEEQVFCEICLTFFPFQLTMYLEECVHCVCVTCATACAKKHLAAPNSTTSNMPCPHEGCPCHLHPNEVQSLLSPDDFFSLQQNEVRMVLRDRCAVCPNCGCTFEMVESDQSWDPLRHRLTCTACHVTFCMKCNTTPFHEGKPCRELGGGAAPKCRYCGAAAVSQDPPVCDSVTCVEKGDRACCITLPCGHLCCGTKGERNCPPCLNRDCASCSPQHCGDDFCVICFTDALEDAPCLALECGHIFHCACLEEKIMRRWPTTRISFSFLECPLCGKEIAHHLLHKVLAPVLKIRSNLESRVTERLRMEGLIDCAAIANPDSPFYNDPVGYGMANLNYYLCSRCSRPYFGGLRDCQVADREEEDKADLICGGCSAGSAVCNEHGNSYMEWKCKYCCNIAVWFCWGTTHFCEQCHSPPRRTVREECPGEERCPIGGKHPPNGQEFALGCAMCRSKKRLK